MTENIIPRNEINQVKNALTNKTFQLEKDNFASLGENIKIAHADCLLALDKMENNSVDCIITDPPYFLDGMENNWNLEKLQQRKDKAKVIGGLPVEWNLTLNKEKDYKNSCC